MYARSIALGFLTAVAFAPPISSNAGFALQSTGAVSLNAAGNDARYGVVARGDGQAPVITVSLGGTTTSALHLVLPGDRLPAPGRYPIRAGGFGASFMPGTAEHPLGWFHGEAGWVTIAQAGEGRVSGTFEVEARGFTAENQEDENQTVTVRGSFDAEGDSTAATIASAE